jgi:hypothetical protein
MSHCRQEYPCVDLGARERARKRLRECDNVQTTCLAMSPVERFDAAAATTQQEWTRAETFRLFLCIEQGLTFQEARMVLSPRSEEEISDHYNTYMRRVCIHLRH